MPGRIQIADVSSDGFPDIMLTAVNKDGGTSTFILMNSPCISQLCSTEARDSMRRVFLESKRAKGKFANDELEIDPRAFLNDVFNQKEALKEYDALRDDFGEFLKPLKNVLYATFFDLMGDSTVDFLIMTKSEGELRTIAVYNNFERDNFYLKARMVSDERLATTVFGASVRCVLTSLSDAKYIVSGSHTGQTGFHALQVPY